MATSNFQEIPTIGQEGPSGEVNTITGSMGTSLSWFEPSEGSGQMERLRAFNDHLALLSRAIKLSQGIAIDGRRGTMLTGSLECEHACFEDMRDGKTPKWADPLPITKQCVRLAVREATLRPFGKGRPRKGEVREKVEKKKRPGKSLQRLVDEALIAAGVEPHVPPLPVDNAQTVPSGVAPPMQTGMLPSDPQGDQLDLDALTTSNGMAGGYDPEMQMQMQQDLQAAQFDPAALNAFDGMAGGFDPGMQMPQQQYYDPLGYAVDPAGDANALLDMVPVNGAGMQLQWQDPQAPHLDPPAMDPPMLTAPSNNMETMPSMQPYPQAHHFDPATMTAPDGMASYQGMGVQMPQQWPHPQPDPFDPPTIDPSLLMVPNPGPEMQWQQHHPQQAQFEPTVMLTSNGMAASHGTGMYQQPQYPQGYPTNQAPRNAFESFATTQATGMQNANPIDQPQDLWADLSLF